MTVELLKSKIHHARITSTALNYEGSLAIDQDLIEAVGLIPYERILVANSTNGARLETYVIVAPRGSRTICLNGAAARLGALGDELTIMAFAHCEPGEVARHKPAVIVLDAQNRIASRT